MLGENSPITQKSRKKFRSFSVKARKSSKKFVIGLFLSTFCRCFCEFHENSITKWPPDFFQKFLFFTNSKIFSTNAKELFCAEFFRFEFVRSQIRVFIPKKYIDFQGFSFQYLVDFNQWIKPSIKTKTRNFNLICAYKADEFTNEKKFLAALKNSIAIIFLRS